LSTRPNTCLRIAARINCGFAFTDSSFPGSRSFAIPDNCEELGWAEKKAERKPYLAAVVCCRWTDNRNQNPSLLQHFPRAVLGIASQCGEHNVNVVDYLLERETHLERVTEKGDRSLSLKGILSFVRKEGIRSESERTAVKQYITMLPDDLRRRNVQNTIAVTVIRYSRSKNPR
jgi:hypothetical protein